MSTHSLELLQDLQEQAAAVARRRGMDAGDADDLGKALAEHLRKHWGGMPLYIPKGLTLDCRQRDARIWEHWNGRNADQLAREHGITQQRLYQILKRQRGDEISRVQMDLDLGAKTT